MLYTVKNTIVDLCRLARCRVFTRVTVEGVVLPLDFALSPSITRNILKGAYENNEVQIVKKTLCETDVVLECGGGDRVPCDVLCEANWVG